MTDLAPLDRALRAARRGHGAAARRLLDGVLATEADNEVAVVWRARVAETPEARAHFLRRALALNPQNRWAQETLDRLGATDAEAPAPTAGGLRATERTDRIDTLSCPNCGGSVEVRPGLGSKAVVCAYCGSVLDLTSRQLDVLGRVKSKVGPRVPIEPGDTATFDGERHLVLGWLRYKGWDDEDKWEWDEWQLVGDTGAVRYLSYSSDEGFLLQTALHPTPTVDARGIDLPSGRVRFSETSPAQITALRGELTWRPKLKETLKVGEAKRGGQQYSVELTADEIEVVGGPALSDVAVWTAFERPEMIEKVRQAEARAQAAGKRARPAWIAAALLLLGAFVAGGVGTTVLDAAVTVPRAMPSVPFGPEAAAPEAAAPEAVALGTFRVEDVEETVEVDVRARLDNTWTAPDLYLVEPSGARTYLFTADLWDEADEADRSDSYLFKPRETGEHRLEVELLESQAPSADLTIEVRRGVWLARYFLFAAVAAVLLGLVVRAAGGTGRLSYR